MGAAKHRSEAQLPAGLVFVRDFLDAEEERQLLTFISGLDFRTVQMHGVVAKRRIKQYGWHYAFQSYRLTPTDPIPEVFENVRSRSAKLANIESVEWGEALVTEYAPGAGIGWHRDAPAFGIVAGISLQGACRMRFQTGEGHERMTTSLDLPARSLYLLTGEARTRWQHMIPATREMRYSITFRTLRKR